MTPFKSHFFALLSILLLPAGALAEQGRQVKVGFLLPMTGEMAFVGTDIQRGAELAESEKHAIQTKSYFEDTQFDMAKTATATKKLIEQEEVDVVVSLWDEADVAAPITERAGKIHIGIRWDPGVTKGRPLTFTLESTYLSYVRAVITLLQRRGIQNVALVGQEIKATELVFNEMEQRLPEAGIKIVSKDQFNAGTRDFRPVFLRATAKKPEVLFIAGYPPDIEPAITQLRQVQPNQRFTGILELVEKLDLIEGIPAVTPFGTAPEFDEKFKKRFGEGYKTRAPHSYEIVRLLQDIYQRLWTDKKPTSSEVALEIQKVQERPSSLGPLTVTGERNIEHPTQFSIVRDGKRVRLSERDLSAVNW